MKSVNPVKLAPQAGFHPPADAALPVRTALGRASTRNQVPGRGGGFGWGRRAGCPEGARPEEPVRGGRSLRVGPRRWGYEVATCGFGRCRVWDRTSSVGLTRRRCHMPSTERISMSAAPMKLTTAATRAIWPISQKA